jgi:hypothetical protein
MAIVLSTSLCSKKKQLIVNIRNKPNRHDVKLSERKYRKIIFLFPYKFSEKQSTFNKKSIQNDFQAIATHCQKINTNRVVIKK